MHNSTSIQNILKLSSLVTEYLYATHFQSTVMRDYVIGGGAIYAVYAKVYAVFLCVC